MKLVLLGYQSARLGTPAEALVNGRRVLVSFAAAQGFCLGTIFVEQDLNRPLSAFTELIAAARRERVAGVVVPSVEELGRLPRVQDLMRSWLERETRVPLLVAQPQIARTTADACQPAHAGPRT